MGLVHGQLHGPVGMERSCSYSPSTQPALLLPALSWAKPGTWEQEWGPEWGGHLHLQH